jgi:hypothetical protein
MPYAAAALQHHHARPVRLECANAYAEFRNVEEGGPSADPLKAQKVVFDPH